VVEELFQIGQGVWCASIKNTQKSVTCPDCLGKKFIFVRLQTSEELSIDCDLCKSGYYGSLGYVQFSEFQAHVERMEVTGIEVRTPSGKPEERVRYSFNYGYFYGCDVFLRADHAEERAEFLMREYTKKEEENFNGKYNHKRNWAWNVRYHRECIRRAQKELVYHTSKLEVSKSHVKEEKQNAS
jgi:hypothetical protein